MSTYAIFPDEKTAAAFVAKIDAAYGFPNADAQTYAIPEACKDGTYTVKIKDWLRADLGQSRRWCKVETITECAKLPVASVVAVKPIALEAMDADVSIIEVEK
jgi:hypothetical protein